MSAFKVCRMGALPRQDTLRLTRQLHKLRRHHADDAPTTEIVIAYRARRILGWWAFWVRVDGRNVTLLSHYTSVKRDARRDGVATALWDYGVAFWKPTRIDASIGSRAGHRFLIHQAKRLAARGVMLRVGSHDHLPNVYQEIYNETVAVPSEARGKKKPAPTAAPETEVH